MVAGLHTRIIIALVRAYTVALSQETPGMNLLTWTRESRPHRIALLTPHQKKDGKTRSGRGASRSLTELGSNESMRLPLLL